MNSHITEIKTLIETANFDAIKVWFDQMDSQTWNEYPAFKVGYPMDSIHMLLMQKFRMKLMNALSYQFGVIHLTFRDGSKPVYPAIAALELKDASKILNLYDNDADPRQYVAENSHFFGFLYR